MQAYADGYLSIYISLALLSPETSDPIHAHSHHTCTTVALLLELTFMFMLRATAFLTDRLPAGVTTYISSAMIRGSSPIHGCRR
jgi:hypothetical protein